MTGQTACFLQLPLTVAAVAAPEVQLLATLMAVVLAVVVGAVRLPTHQTAALVFPVKEITVETET
jgi:hypothetical protein